MPAVSPTSQMPVPDTALPLQPRRLDAGDMCAGVQA